MNQAYVNGAAKVATFLAMIFALTPQAVAQTWQSPGKTATIPVVVANTACNSSTDTAGITADRSTLLTCQSGSWKKQATASSVVAAPLSAYVGRKTIRCANYGSGDPWNSYNTTSAGFIVAKDVTGIGGGVTCQLGEVTLLPNGWLNNGSDNLCQPTEPTLVCKAVVGPNALYQLTPIGVLWTYLGVSPAMVVLIPWAT